VRHMRWNMSLTRRKRSETNNMASRLPDSFAEQDASRALDDCIQAQETGANRPVVRIERRAVRLMDDWWNNVGGAKDLIDCLRCTKLIPGDSDKEIDLERPRQTKVAKKDVGTLIEIEYP